MNLRDMMIGRHLFANNSLRGVRWAFPYTINAFFKRRALVFENETLGDYSTLKLPCNPSTAFGAIHR